MKDIKNLIKKIELVSNSLTLDKKNLDKFILQTLKLNMSLEKIIFSNSNQNPKLKTKKLLKKYLNLQNKNFVFKKKNKINHVYKQEKHHKHIFQQLWSRYNLQQYKDNRIDRYLYRIKINNLKNIIKDKKVVDLGCGHGNFLVACYKNGAKYCYGIDFGKKNIQYSNKIIKYLKLDKKKINFKVKNIYRTEIKSSTFDFAIQNGVFHHLDDEIKCYKEAARILNKNAYFWVYTDGSGGIRDLVTDMSQRILRQIERNKIFNIIWKNLGINKSYHFSDNLTVQYRHHTYKSIINVLKKCGFKNFKQLNGGFKTDFDKPFAKVKYFKEKFGGGDLRILCQKK